MKQKIKTIAITLVIGVFLGWLVFHPSRKTEEKHDHLTEDSQGTVWTCAMHPQIRIDQPGKCPICGMDLIPVTGSGDSSVDPDAVHLTKEAAQLAYVLTSVVSKHKPVKEVRLYGKVQADERLLQSQVAHVPGRIERLYVNFTGEEVKNGQVLAQIYSPELITAQQELLEAAKTKLTQPAIYDAAKEKLRHWKLTDNQIEIIESSGNVQTSVDVISNTGGIVTLRLVNTGDYVSQGTSLFKIADLSRVWILFDAYESDLQFLARNQRITFTLQAFPGTEFSGTVAFIDPVIDPVTRVAKVRVEAGNQSGKLKPEMFAAGIVEATLTEYRDNLVIPKTAVLWTGKRSIVYVKQVGSAEPVFKIREIGLGPVLGESYIVTDGLSEGEEIITMGTFSVDAAAQLEGKPSMMNPGYTRRNIDAGRDNSVSRTSEKTRNIDVSIDFIMQLNSLFDQYIFLKNSLVQSDMNKARQTAQDFQHSLLKVEMKLLAGDAHTQWMDLSGIMESQVRLIVSSGSIEEQRIAFSDFSDQLFKAIKTFGLLRKTAYYQFCPMAKNGKGAYWLSETKDIRNPYFGESMLTCGETKETMNY